MDGRIPHPSGDEAPVPEPSGNGSGESFAVDPPKSLTAEVAEESLTGVEAPDALDSRSPPGTANTRVIRLTPSSFLSRPPTTQSPARKPCIACDLTAATESSRDCHPASPGAGRRSRACDLPAMASVTSSRRPPSRTHVRDARRRSRTVRTTGQANAVAPSVTRPRGGRARPIGRPTTAAPAKGHASTTPTRSPGQPATQPTTTTTTRPHRQHPITPCQSTGICVPD